MLSLPYHEPSAADVLLLSSFFLVLNFVNYALDSLLYCGLIGQVLIGIAFGTPGAQWLGVPVEEVIVQFGYLGLLLMIFEGGLSTSFRSLKANILLSACIALTGVAVPMGLSFVLERLAGATPLQAFAAGAALCATSLGTTFTVLSTTGLTSSRLGVALTSAAMIDDVIGLVLVQVISRLGGSDTSISAGTVLRPIFTSIALVVVAILVAWLAVKPVTEYLNTKRQKKPGGIVDKALSVKGPALVVETLLLFGLVAASSYAGASNLFAAYIAGAAISWWDSEVDHTATAPRIVANGTEPGRQNATAAPPATHSPPREDVSGLQLFEKYYRQPLLRVFQPLFFASIGFSIPISRMFDGTIVWRGFVYGALMAIGKLVCGLWLVRITWPSLPGVFKRASLPRLPHFWGARGVDTGTSRAAAGRTDSRTSAPHTDQTQRATQRATAEPTQATSGRPSPEIETKHQTSTPAVGQDSGRVTESIPSAQDHLSPQPRKPTSLYPASILGWAMVARGEIGFLISSIAESNGIFSSQSGGESGPSNLYLVVTWAIVLCTVLGPISVGLIVRRVKRLEKGATRTGREDVLGVWGLVT